MLGGKGVAFIYSCSHAPH